MVWGSAEEGGDALEAELHSSCAKILSFYKRHRPSWVSKWLSGNCAGWVAANASSSASLLGGKTVGPLLLGSILIAVLVRCSRAAESSEPLRKHGHSIMD